MLARKFVSALVLVGATVAPGGAQVYVPAEPGLTAEWLRLMLG